MRRAVQALVMGAAFIAGYGGRMLYDKHQEQTNKQDTRYEMTEKELWKGLEQWQEAGYRTFPVRENKTINELLGKRVRIDHVNIDDADQSCSSIQEAYAQLRNTHPTFE